MVGINMKLDNLKLLRDAKHTKIYSGESNGENYYLKILKNYNKKVKNQDVLKSKEILEKLGLKCFTIVETGEIKGEKYYISKEVSGKDFEELLNEGRTFKELEGLIEESMGKFMEMLKNDYYYFGYNLKNFISSDNELILIDIEEIQKKRIFKRKALVKTIWNSLRSLKAASIRCNLSYEELEKMLFRKYDEIVGGEESLKKDIKRYESLRDLKKIKKRR